MRALLLLLLALIASVCGAQNLQPIPPLTAHVVDQTGTLDAIQVKGLEDKLMAFEQAKGTQIAILMVPTTQPEDDASYANRVGNAWKIGRKGVGDGVLIVVAKNDRKIRVEVAKALEGAVPDLAAKGIIDEAIRPAFRKDDYAGGLHAGVDQIIARINGEALPAPKAAGKQSSGSGFDWMDLAIFLFFAVPIVGGGLRAVLGRKLGSFLTGTGVGVIALFITSSIAIAAIAAFVALLFTLLSGGFGGLPTGRRSGWGGGPWIGGGGGGGWSSGSSSSGSWGGSGGGGDFGGGGASGDW